MAALSNENKHWAPIARTPHVLDAVLLIHCVLADTPRIAEKDKKNKNGMTHQDTNLGVVQGPSSA